MADEFVEELNRVEKLEFLKDLLRVVEEDETVIDITPKMIDPKDFKCRRWIKVDFEAFLKFKAING